MRHNFLWYAGHVYRDRTGVEYLLEGENRGGLQFVYLSQDGPIGAMRSMSGYCTDAGESDGDILPGFKLREFGSTEADMAYMKRWGYA
jgi:hypothetical protein